MILEKIKCMYDIGGSKYLFLRTADLFCGTEKTKDYQYQIFSSAPVDQRPRLLKDWFYINTGSHLNLDNPQSFNEKIQWMKLYDDVPEKTKLADKYLVRDWVKEKVGKEHLIPLLGVWDRFDDIDFSLLPDKFVLKCNHGSHMNIVVNDKSKFDQHEAKRMVDKWMQTNYAFAAGFQMHYENIIPKIIAEKYIEQIDNNLMDYKIHTFNGIPKIIQIIGDRKFSDHGGKEAFLNTQWEPMKLKYHTYENYENIPDKPENFDKMLKIAEKLAEGFSYVRVDLYNLSGKILFGEMTFTPASGKGKWGERDTIFSKLMDMS